MGFASNSTTSRTNLQQTIRNKQQLCNRFNRRYNSTTNPGERTFLRQEINRCVSELRQCARQWKNCGFGSTGWITNGFTTRTPGTKGKNNTRTSGRRTGSRNSTRRTGSRSRSRTSSRTRSYSFSF